MSEQTSNRYKSTIIRNGFFENCIIGEHYCAVRSWRESTIRKAESDAGEGCGIDGGKVEIPPSRIVFFYGFSAYRFILMSS